MTRFFSKSLASTVAASALVMGFATTSAHAVPVDLELVLLMDVSGSVNATEFALQQTGYVNAFNSGAVQTAIGNTTNGIAVTMVQWANGAVQSIGWSHLTDGTSSSAFATAIAGMARQTAGTFGNSTNLGEALVFGAGLFGTETGGAGNGFESVRQLIDISGDGADNNGGTSSSQGRNFALGAGVEVINGIAILGEAGLLSHYQTEVIGGLNGNGSPAFALTANGFADFETAITQKLLAEVTGTGIPEPGMMAIFGLGLLGLGVMRRRMAA